MVKPKSGIPAVSPVIVCFSGHMIDGPVRPVPRFPASAEGRVRQGIDAALARVGATVGFSAAASGSDILFLEAMAARGGTTVIVLPFDAAQFRQISVDPLPGSWGPRFDAVMTRASRVLIAYKGEVRGTGDDFERGNRLLMGSAITRSTELRSKLVPLVVWDGKAAGGRGGTATFVSDWQMLGYEVEIVDLEAIVAPAV